MVISQKEKREMAHFQEGKHQRRKKKRGHSCAVGVGKTRGE